MKDIKKVEVLFSPSDLNLKKRVAPDPAILHKGIGNHALRNTGRNGNYSAIGYTLLDSPPTEAERWNKPFVDPEFGYESRNTEFH